MPDDDDREPEWYCENYGPELVEVGATVVRALGQAVGRMPQLLTQLAGWASDLAARPELSMCDFAGPGPAPDTAGQAAEQLLAAAERLAEIDIASAASALGQLYLDTDDAGEPEDS